jgi:DNA-binding transcriptional regulator/RsmH inhibitor MraZ
MRIFGRIGIVLLFALVGRIFEFDGPWCFEMLTLKKDKFYESGFCYGRYEATVADDGRLRLNKVILDTLCKHNITKLWVYPDPTGPSINLCPPESREAYIQIANNNLPETMCDEEAFRKFVCSGVPKHVDNQGRIALSRFLMKHAGIEPATQASVEILGVGLWFEVRLDDN